MENTAFQPKPIVSRSVFIGPFTKWTDYKIKARN